MRRASAETFRTDLRRSLRIVLPLLWLFRCDDPQRLWVTLPVAVTLNRFLSPLWVFILCEGMGERLRAASGPGPAEDQEIGRAKDCTTPSGPSQRQSHQK